MEINIDCQRKVAANTKPCHQKNIAHLEEENQRLREENERLAALLTSTTSTEVCKQKRPE